MSGGTGSSSISSSASSIINHSPLTYTTMSTVNPASVSIASITGLLPVSCGMSLPPPSTVLGVLSAASPTTSLCQLGSSMSGSGSSAGLPSLPDSATGSASSSTVGGPFVPESPDDTLEDLGPMQRDRCNTWPMRRPQLDINAQTSPLIHEKIPEEENDVYDSTENLGRLGATSAASTGLLSSPDGTTTFSPGPGGELASPTMGGSMGNVTPDHCGGVDGLPGSKKSNTRRNAWGNLSYADLITQAIASSPEKRLTLSQVYEWMVQNVPYFRDKGDSNSSAGWKNSIRHNLSLHSRFMRIQNEGAGKSSWWVINPDAKPGRNPRRTRAATIDSTTKAKLEKGRRGARKKVAEMRMGLPLHSGVSSLAGSQASIMSHDIYGEEDTFDPFRPRTQSTLSMPGSSTRVSPSMDHTMVDDFDFPPWVDAATAIQPGIPSDIVDRTDQMRLDACRGLMNGIIKQEPKVIKWTSFQQEPTTPMYHELNSVRGGAQMQNPLLRGTQIGKFPPGYGIPPMYSAYGTPPPPPPTSGPMGWPGSPVTTLTSMPSCGAQQFVGLTSSNALSASSALLGAASSALPMDLENLTLPDAPLMEMDVESLLRHELSQTRDHQINFDI